MLHYTYDEIKNDMRSKAKKKIAHNTYAIKAGDRIGIQYHDSVIVSLSPDNAIFNPNGWYTSTTKLRLNWFLNPFGMGVYQKSHIWYVWDFTTHNDIGIVDGQFSVTKDKITYGLKSLSYAKKAGAQDKKVRAYCKAYVKRLLEGKIKPSSGDCLFCQFNLPDSRDHIESHIAESYFVGSLLYHALQFKPVSYIANAVIQNLFLNDGQEDYTVFYDIAKEQVTKSLYAYISHCLKLEE